jgi:hypothetical protein
LIGKKDPSKGWTQNIHYVNISPDIKKKDTIRIPWNRLIASFAKNNDVSLLSFRARTKYKDVQEDKQKYVPNRSVPRGEDGE